MNGSATLRGPFAGNYESSDLPAHAIVTYTGHAFDITDVSTWTYDTEDQRTDIARSLSNVCRYGGHTQFYSVAEHSVRVANYLKEMGHPPQVQRLGLWHDATEAYMGDVPRPMKPLFKVMGSSFESVEDELALAIFENFDLEYSDYYWESVKEADMAIFYLEQAERPYCASFGKYAEVPKVAEQYWLLRDQLLADECQNGSNL